LNWLLSLLLNSAALLVADHFVRGIEIKGFLSALIAALLLGFVNSFIRPVLVFLTLPITVMTLGLFILVINAITFAFVSWFVPGFTVHNFSGAFMGALITGVVSWMLNIIFNDR